MPLCHTQKAMRRMGFLEPNQVVLTCFNLVQAGALAFSDYKGLLILMVLSGHMGTCKVKIWPNPC